MSPEPHEGAPPEDGPLVRPYVTPPTAYAHATTPAWPLGPAVPVPVHEEPRAPEPAPRRRRDQRRLPLVAPLALLTVCGAGALWLLSGGPEREPARAVPHPGLSVPALAAGGSGAEPASEAGSARPTAPRTASSAPATPTASATVTPSPSATPAAKPVTPTAKPPVDASGTLRRGDSGPQVRALQERLYGQGFTYVSPTGVYDKQTERGVAQLQRDRDIKGDPRGVYGPATRAAFG
ncbi:peptidoglycan-binding protein [Streptomyces sp. RerS4]|uniref:peptidoglycan-binding protein n=1 Tax=Streptomyces sp. RerS4 TaxID=2942449 RepID=UPI00201BBA85|nr:peptidoglycan-binding protein [Streptomyces sp. RerS4]UQW99769.1 peptidoglycan-binding protein [Streptomyces sp. RerS4]